MIVEPSRRRNLGRCKPSLFRYIGAPGGEQTQQRRESGRNILWRDPLPVFFDCCQRGSAGRRVRAPEMSEAVSRPGLVQADCIRFERADIYRAFWQRRWTLGKQRCRDIHFVSHIRVWRAISSWPGASETRYDGKP
jgi:hypothetical protein